ncbi:MAG: VIT and VWA domain-containing protein [Myxococcota bacterium]|nr:VWA domain-containing protein [Deltaproteobacteria bacterium]MDQ3334555.1 VIT and VWA domain-containing protein [Myxococcota bacterium]
MSRFHLALLIALAGCGSTPRDPDYSSGTTVDLQIEITDNFAAMEEVPVAGGELRLVAPRPMKDAHGTSVQAIAFPLRHTDVRTKVSGMSAMYTVTQTFENPYDEAIDAVYVFPLGDEAAITDYAIVIGERTIAGEIKRKKEAQQIYEEAKSQGHTAALLEQEKRNIFKQRIANIAPREQIKVKMQYIELLDYQDGQYEIAFPLVVGPRYLPADAIGKTPVGSHHAGQSGRDGVTSIPYADEKIAGSTVSFRADVDAGVPVLAVASPSHQLRVEEPANTKRVITLAAANEVPNRDLVVRYKTANEQTMVGLLAHRTEKKGYFTLVVQPKAQYKTGDITNRELMIVIDTSGSMQGQPLDQAQRLATALIDSLKPGDTFNVMAFSGGTNAMAPAAIAGDAAGKQHGKQFVASLESGGGTEMGPAMAKALATTPGNDRIRLVYFVTDGFVGNDDVIVSAARGNLGANRIFSIGVGSAVNRSLLNQIAAVGRGYASYLNLTENPADLGEDLVARTAYPYLTDIKIEWNGLAVGGVTPAAIPDVYAGMPLIVSGVYTQPGRGKITVTATTAGRRVQIPVEVTLPDRLDQQPVAALWGRKQIDELYALAGDAITDSTVKKITELGLQFHMVTDYTSFVAVDRTRVVNANGTSKVIEQPALVPAGVNPESAIGPEAASPSSSSSSRSSGGGDYGGGWSGGGGGGGGDVDWITLLLGLALIPLAWTLRRIRS